MPTRRCDTLGERVKDKAAIVVGAGSLGPGMGNGKASALLYAREGAKVLAVDRSLQAAEETRCLVVEEGGQCVAFQADISNPVDCRALVQQCLDVFGRIDILHNNVGIVDPWGVLESTEEDWDRVIGVNLRGMFLTCKYVLPHMVLQGKGAIVNISSIAATTVLSHAATSYAASKAGIVALTREIAVEYAPKGIRANAILPGYMKTPQVTVNLTKAYGGDPEKMMAVRDAMCPMGHQGDAWDVAYAALFLASDEAKYITGTTLVVDGGITCTHRMA